MKLGHILAPSVSVFSSLAAASWVYIDYHHRPRLVTGPMVQMLRPEGFTVVFRVHPPAPVNVEVFTGFDPHPVAVAAAAPSPAGWQATFDGLRPGRRYRYRLVTASEGGLRLLLGEAEACTAPGPGGAFRALAFGDSGSGFSGQWRLARLMPAFDPDLILHTGDIVYDDGAAEDYYWKFFAPYRPLLGRSAVYPVLGNHDVRTDRGRPALDAFVLPENGPPAEPPEYHYWFDFGCARIVAIDSNRDEDFYREQIGPWLDEVLAGAGDRWKILYWHEPVYTSGRYEPADKLRRPLGPIIDRHEVDLVLHGHNHMYQRTRRLRGGAIAPDGRGTVYLTTAAGGARLYEPRRPLPDHIAVSYNEMLSFTVLDVAPQTILIRQVAMDGQVIDVLAIDRLPAQTRPAA